MERFELLINLITDYKGKYCTMSIGVGVCWLNNSYYETK